MQTSCVSYQSTTFSPLKDKKNSTGKYKTNKLMLKCQKLLVPMAFKNLGSYLPLNKDGRHNENLT